MKRKTIILLFILSCYTIQPSSEKIPAVIYHFEGSQEAYGIEEAHDGKHYIISGWTDEGGKYYPPRCMLLKINKEGKLIERKIYENLEWSCDAIVKTKNNNYLIRSNLYLVLMDNRLNILTKLYLPNSTPNFVVDIFERFEKGIAIVTTTDLGLPRGYHIYSFDGTIKDSISIQFQNAEDVVSAVIEKLDSSIYIVGRYISQDTSGYRILKLNVELDTITTNFIDVKSLFGYSAGYVKGIESVEDGTLIVAAIIVRGFLDGFSAIFKVDTNGNLISYDTIDYSMTTIMDITKLRDGDIALIGSALRDGIFFTFAMRLKPDLSVVWYREYFNEFTCYIAFGSVIQDSEGNLVIGGYCAGLDDIAFMKLDAKTGEPLIWQEY